MPYGIISRDVKNAVNAVCVLSAYPVDNPTASRTGVTRLGPEVDLTPAKCRSVFGPKPGE